MNDAAVGGDTEAVIITFALPDESRPFVEDLSGRRRVKAPGLPTFVGDLHGKMTAVVHTGVGDTAAGRDRLKGMLAAAETPVRWVLSAGYAGALRPGMAVGDLVLAENRSDPALAASARTLLADEPLHIGALTTETAVAGTVAAKAALAATTGALAVDMETGWIAGVCAWAGVPILSLRVVSDAADQPLPVPGHILFDAARQRPPVPRPARVAAGAPRADRAFCRFRAWTRSRPGAAGAGAAGADRAVVMVSGPVLPPRPKSAMGGIFP